MEITGRLTRDAIVRDVGQTQVVSFSVAVNQRYRDRNGQRQTKVEYFNCAYWISPKVAAFLTKGSIVEVSGWLSSHIYTGNDGQPKTSLDLRTDRITFHGGGQQRPEQGIAGIPVYGPQAVQDEEPHDDLPF